MAEGSHRNSGRNWSRDQEETLFTDLLCHLSFTFYHLPPTFLGSQAGQIVLLPPSFVRIQTDPNPSLDPSLEVREGRCLSFLWHSIADTKCSTNHGNRLHNHKAGSLLCDYDVNSRSLFPVATNPTKPKCYQKLGSEAVETAQR